MTKKLKDYHKIGLTLLAGLVLAVGVLFFLSWLAEEVFEGDTIQVFTRLVTLGSDIGEVEQRIVRKGAGKLAATSMVGRL